MMITIYNTLTHAKETFAPQRPDHVGLYVCGPTVYDFAHIGNARPVVVFDTLVRLLRHFYPKVTYVRNITDVDDKINASAHQNGESIATLTERTTAMYHADMSALGADSPDIEPRATHHIADMIEIIQQLIAKNHAYEAQGHVLFSVQSFKEYGQLSRRNQDELLAGARVEIAPYKKNPADFVLWKPSEDETPGWESPWGYGRPGWHIECSAMSARYLGETFDIHGGGHDLIFPHHENEIAQSCCAHDTSLLARYWMHNAHLTVDGTKMSKSLGNFVTVHQLLDSHPGEVIRMGLLTTHYRMPLDWTNETIEQAKNTLDRLYQALRQVPENETDYESHIFDYDPQVLAALCDDLNTPLAIARLHELASEINKTSTEEKVPLAARLRKSAQLLGVLQQDPLVWFQQGAKLSAETIDSMIEERRQARFHRDFKKSDDIRNELLHHGIILEDSSLGTTWRRA